MVLPGGEFGANADVPILRSGSASSDERLLADMKALTTRVVAGSADAEEMISLVAVNVSQSQLDVAETVLTSAKQRFPQEYRLDLLEAAIAYRRSELRTSERLLRDLAGLHPNSALVRLNLGIVLRDSGHMAEARDAWLDAIEAVLSPTSPLGRRAGREIRFLGFGK